jgi:hypothetical protein
MVRNVLLPLTVICAVLIGTAAPPAVGVIVVCPGLIVCDAVISTGCALATPTTLATIDNAAKHAARTGDNT